MADEIRELTERERKERIEYHLAELRRLRATPRSDWHAAFEAPLRIEAIRRDRAMDDVLMEIVKDRVDEKVNTAVNAREQQTTVNHINDIMTKLRYTAEQAMDLLSIPQSQRSTYAGLVGKNAR